MSEIRSALGAAYAPGHHGVAGTGVTLRERLDLDLVQVAAFAQTREPLTAALSHTLGMLLPADGRTASLQGDVTVYQIAPGRYLISRPWGVGATLFDELTPVIGPDVGAVTDLSHARSFIELRGEAAREVLARGFALDLDPLVFGENAFAQTPVHHISTLLHRLPGEPSAFRILVLRTFARSFWEWLFETSEAFGCEVLEAQR
jgi:heterotetrameric sarcosine oxidase gamma subunit